MAPALDAIFISYSNWLARGDRRFFSKLELRAGGALCLAWLPPRSDDHAIAACIKRTRGLGIAKPLLLFSKPDPRRNEPFGLGSAYDFQSVQADFHDVGQIARGRDTWSIRLLANSQIEIGKIST